MERPPEPEHGPAWTEERLLALDPHEYDFQEFKGSAYVFDAGQQRLRSDFLDNLSKQVSAFANAGGGRIFLGLDDEGRIDGGVPSDVRPNGTRAWLEDVIPHVVTPHVRAFNVYEVTAAPGAPSAILPGRAVFVIDIPRSEDAPHQARDHRYYLRIAGKSRPMGHHHVLDVLHRTRDPHVVVSRMDPYGEAEFVESDPRGPKAFVHLRTHLINRGRSLAQHVGCEFVVPRFAVNSECRQRTLAQGETRLVQRSGEVVFFFYHPIPIFPTQEVPFGEVWLAIHGANLQHFEAGRVSLRWRVFADGAPVREGHVDVLAYTSVQRAIRQVAAGHGRTVDPRSATSGRLRAP
ncbi:MAG: ATP-binding protein [Planctomycetes bacterium]|nr:ATP-binding protein [Planctomycetota bacterium]